MPSLHFLSLYGELAKGVDDYHKLLYPENPPSPCEVQLCQSNVTGYSPDICRRSLEVFVPLVDRAIRLFFFSYFYLCFCYNNYLWCKHRGSSAVQMRDHHCAPKRETAYIVLAALRSSMLAPIGSAAVVNKTLIQCHISFFLFFPWRIVSFVPSFSYSASATFLPPLNKTLCYRDTPLPCPLPFPSPPPFLLLVV